jgi:hypothetical protein
MSRREFSPDVRHAAFVRAGFRCEKCESKERLELHHIGNRQDRSAFNAMVLCVRCHAKLHADRRALWWTTTICGLHQNGVGRATIDRKSLISGGYLGPDAPPSGRGARYHRGFLER